MTTPNLDEVDEQRRRTMLIAGVLSVVVLLIGVGAALALLVHRPVATKPPITPAEETSETPEVSEEPSVSVVPTTAVVTTPTPSAVTTTPTTVATTTAQIVRSGRIAYRLGGQVWVSGEDGSNAKAVYTSAMGAFALSPDGRTLVTASSPSAYVLIDTANLAQLPITGPVDLPSWSPDSSWLAYTARTSTGGYAVRRVNRTGLGDALVVTGGAKPQIAPDGKRVAITQSIDPGTNDTLQVYDTSTKVLRGVPNGRGVQTFAWASGGVLYFAKDRIGTAAGWLGTTNRALTKTSVVASLPVTDPPTSPGVLYPSPDGSKVLFAMSGDDGHSRLLMADVGAKKITSISTQNYDAYPMGWLLDGSAVLYIQGNATQQEATSLYRIRPNGTKRTEVVKGAGL
jgi:Tol biopolymer transport system component